MSQPSDTINAPSAKRPRTELDPDPTLTRSEIWYDDGSVILQAESTQFRVHWTILCLHSTIFRDMRGLPQPADEQPTIEGCPVIQLHDSSVDVKYLLDVLYDPLLCSVEKPSLAFIGALIRLGRKYDFKHLLAAAVQRLTYENPTTFDEYEKTVNETGGYVPQKYKYTHSSLFDIITLAQENGLFAVLPCAYLRAIRFCTSDAILKSENTSLVLGERRLLEAQWKHEGLWQWLRQDQCAAGCTNNITCAQNKELIFRALIKNHYSLVPFRRLAPTPPPFCGPCVLHHAKIMAGARKKLWEDLPTFFGLAPWAELKNDI